MSAHPLPQLLPLLVAAGAVLCPAAAYLFSNYASEDLQPAPQPQPQVLIHFPKTTEIGCFEGERPPAGSRGVFFQLDRVLGLDHTCKFITYNMRDYRGTTDAYRFRRLVSMYPDIVRPDRRLQCDASTGALEELPAGDFEVLRAGRSRVCRMVADEQARADVRRLQLREGYKRLPGGALLLRSWYDLPGVSRPRGRYARSTLLSRAQQVVERHESAAAAAARIDAEAQRRKLNGGRG